MSIIKYSKNFKFFNNKYNYKKFNYNNKGKFSTVYRGVDIAEYAVDKVFNNFIRMPRNNKGYDFIYEKKIYIKIFKNILIYLPYIRNIYKIDVKSSIMYYKKGYKHHFWHFVIKRNKKCDYFVFVAFDNKLDINIKHVWFIPGNIIDNISSISISNRSLNKWQEYELTDKLNEFIYHCNVIKKSLQYK